MQIGVYGLMAFSVEQRMPEFGIRRALGGSNSNVVRLILRRGATLASTGVGLGLVGAWILARFIRGLLFGVAPFEPLTFAVLAGVSVIVTLLASLLPALRATRADPVASLSSH